MPQLTKSSLAKQASYIKSYLGAVLWAAFIMLLCGLPGQDLPNIDFWAIDIEDKIAHLGVFAILGFLIVYGFKRRNPSQKVTLKHVLVFSLIAGAYGGLTEILQGLLFPTRFASVTDFIADFLGGILGIIIAKYLFNKRS